MAKDNFEKIFEEKFRSFEGQPSSQAKDEIFATLNKEGLTIMQKVGIALFLLFFSAATIYLLQKERSTTKKSSLEQLQSNNYESIISEKDIPKDENPSNRNPQTVNSLIKTDLPKSTIDELVMTKKENKEHKSVASKKLKKETNNLDKLISKKLNKNPQRISDFSEKGKSSNAEKHYYYSYLNHIKKKPYLMPNMNLEHNLVIPNKMIQIDTLDKNIGESSQDILPKLKNPSRIFLTSSMETFMNYNNILVNRNDQLLITEVVNKPSISLDRLGLRLQVGLGINISKKLSVIAQITSQYAQYNVSYKEQVASFDSLAVEESPNEVIVHVYRNKNSQSIKINRYSIGFKTSVIYNYSKDSKINRSINLSTSYLADIGAEKGYLRSKQLYFSIGHIFDYQLSDKLSFQLEPTIAYSLWNGESDHKIFLKPYSIGLGFGL